MAEKLSCYKDFAIKKAENDDNINWLINNEKSPYYPKVFNLNRNCYLFSNLVFSRDNNTY